MEKLSHIADDGRPAMVDVGDKPVSHRVAKAEGFIELKKETIKLVDENKIKKGARSIGQIEKQYQFFKESEDNSEDTPIVSVFITPDDKTFESSYLSGKESNPNTVWLKWVNHKQADNSIESTLRNLIVHEQNAEIQPIDMNTQFIIKSFIDYIASEFRVWIIE